MTISVQDKILHVDNTTFKEEYKVLLTWRRGQVKGSSDQNFTFLLWTHKNNQDVRVNDEGLPWSMERDSLFDDGQEEIRKPGRKIVGEMKLGSIKARLTPWAPELRSSSFSACHLVEPKLLKEMCDAIVTLTDCLALERGSELQHKNSGIVLGQKKIIMSLSRLIQISEKPL
ncbi:hypothetical protein K431DRAFT_316945 [Polychaeton citri CBS 116435]|uniref:Uncharacterized protein n=1 Tax=Polychaeton citri CBS 116435 TaxID=1314669 RepID=A0A9P4PZX0_9PEZI|nr:hypothetical protein K431DRAFT_316945 [Polychaeton citri CBS 116435]